jgi:Na+-transporting NADH:ubiquinone oxidoreductase subunit NqrF
MITVLLGVAMFTGVIVSLVAILMVAKNNDIHPVRPYGDRVHVLRRHSALGS